MWWIVSSHTSPLHCVSSTWTSDLHQPHKCCNGLYACLECDQSGFELWSGQTKDNKIVICCFSAKHTALRRKSKYWLIRNQDNVSEWGCCFNELAKHPTKCVGLVQAYLIIISLNINLLSQWFIWTFAELALSNNHPLARSFSKDVFRSSISFLNLIRIHAVNFSSLADCSNLPF